MPRTVLSFTRRARFSVGAIAFTIAHVVRAQTVAVTGTVYDSVSGAPLAGALVQLAAERDPTRVLSAEADSLGRYRITGVSPGRYLAGFVHPALDLLGLDPSMHVVDIPADTARRLDLAIPGGTRLRAAICGSTARADDSTGAIVGQVRDAETDAPLDSARVVVTWQELALGDGARVHLERRRIPAAVRPGGYYAICGVPADDPIVGGAEAPGRRAGLVELRVPAGRVLRRDFRLADSAAATVAAAPNDSAPDPGAERLRGHATLRGVVRRPDGRPASGARVLLLGTDRRADAGDDGRFVLEGLPSGTFSVEARALGFDARRVPVELSSRRASDAEIVLGSRVTTLETVRVMGAPTRSSRARAWRSSSDSGGAPRGTSCPRTTWRSRPRWTRPTRCVACRVWRSCRAVMARSTP
ncbi:hypothetical protein J421_1180 [Gemmatirosa kalamazoonensis]|uniref:Carboxypeptidase regulatory-like domain-containing protein n=1 Tax=Gemmatirosa kalamazoonensis TaxID=861299 RepID=W0RE74_9BACT|nr:carboxypeptidase-like regulatory domain-containing protein [Gemmatirosa kalamazoonensis]AHG88717.1 hypothetical protein J421_1180 [Gemmatirosa kalamazoonensis]